ncbi:hypothetical protein BJ912DRAFT_1003645 [Pholiota molesta]|nr:hypothetical protein BJ912DRAFT_1003645 [Pholiota molesta]
MAGSHSGWAQRARAGQAGRVRSGRSPELDGYGAGDGYISNDGPAPLPGSAATRRTYTRVRIRTTTRRAARPTSRPRAPRAIGTGTAGASQRQVSPDGARTMTDDGARRCTNGRDGGGYNTHPIIIPSPRTMINQVYLVMSTYQISLREPRECVFEHRN